MPYRTLTLDAINPRGLEGLPREHYLVGPDLKDPDVLLVRSTDLHGMSIGASVRAIGRAGPVVCAHAGR
jgi:D-3-phosphoglycerate dehydrogenase